MCNSFNQGYFYTCFFKIKGNFKEISTNSCHRSVAIHPLGNSHIAVNEKKSKDMSDKSSQFK